MLLFLSVSNNLKYLILITLLVLHNSQPHFQMLASHILKNVHKSTQGALHRRNLGILAPCLQKASDPIQQLFIDKLREYKQKSGGGNKLFEASSDIEKELKSELEKVAKVYGGGAGTDMTQFPTVKFTDPVIDPINMESK